MKAKVFSGNPEEVQELLNQFLTEKSIKVLGFAQSQSTMEGAPAGSYTAGVLVTTTILYHDYGSEREPVMGFSR